MQSALKIEKMDFPEMIHTYFRVSIDFSLLGVFFDQKTLESTQKKSSLSGRCTQNLFPRVRLPPPPPSQARADLKKKKISLSVSSVSLKDE